MPNKLRLGILETAEGMRVVLSEKDFQAWDTWLGGDWYLGQGRRGDCRCDYVASGHDMFIWSPQRALSPGLDLQLDILFFDLRRPARRPFSSDTHEPCNHSMTLPIVHI